MKYLIIVISLFILKMNGNAQDKIIGAGKYKHTTSDSLYHEFSNTVYYSFYSPNYMSNKTSTFTILKVDIDKNGKVTDIRFSDSADSVFVNAFLHKPKYHDDKATLEKYAKLKSYKNTSLLIPVNFEPNYPKQSRIISYDELESFMKFGNKIFTGNSIMFKPINIIVGASGNW